MRGTTVLLLGRFPPQLRFANCDGEDRQWRGIAPTRHVETLTKRQGDQRLFPPLGVEHVTIDCGQPFRLVPGWAALLVARLCRSGIRGASTPA